MILRGQLGPLFQIAHSGTPVGTAAPHESTDVRLSHGKEGCGFHQLTFHLPQKLSRLHLTGKDHLPWAMMDKGPLSLSSGTLVYTVSIPTVAERGSIT